MLHRVVVGKPRCPCGMLRVAQTRSKHSCVWSVIVFHERHRKVAVRSRKWPRVVTVTERPSEVLTKASLNLAIRSLLPTPEWDVERQNWRNRGLVRTGPAFSIHLFAPLMETWEKAEIWTSQSRISRCHYVWNPCEARPSPELGDLWETATICVSVPRPTCHDNTELSLLFTVAMETCIGV